MAGASGPRTPRRPGRAAERRRQKDLARVEALESEIAALEGEILSLEESFADPAVARDGSKVRALRAGIEDRRTLISQRMREWEELSRKLHEEPAVR